MTDYSFSRTASPTYAGSLGMLADVEFGVMQADGSCVGIGICRIITTHQWLSRPRLGRRCPRAQAFLSLSSDGRLTMYFPRDGMLPCTERTFFRPPVLALPVPVVLPPALFSHLPELQQNILPAGLYTIHREVNGYRVVF